MVRVDGRERSIERGKRHDSRGTYPARRSGVALPFRCGVLLTPTARANERPCFPRYRSTPPELGPKQSPPDRVRGRESDHDATNAYPGQETWLWRSNGQRKSQTVQVSHSVPPEDDT